MQPIEDINILSEKRKAIIVMTYLHNIYLPIIVSESFSLALLKHNL